MTAWGPAAAAADASPEEQIETAYALVLDRSAPMVDRIAAIDQGRGLRDVLEEFDELIDTGGLRIAVEDVSLHVQSVRLHRSVAEVELSVTVDGGLLTGWHGVASKVDGRWRVARATLCTLLADWTPIRCPGGPGPTSSSTGLAIASRPQDGQTVIALTFADGGRGDLVVPDELADGWTANPRAELRLGDGTPVPIWLEEGKPQAQQPVLRYRGASGQRDVVLDAMRGLAIPLDGWTAYVLAETFTEGERRLIAGHLDGHTTTEGFPVLTPIAPLQFRDRPPPPATSAAMLVKSALNVDAAANPVELSRSAADESYVSVVVTPGPCPTELQRPIEDPTFHAEERCLPGGVGRIAVEGSPTLAIRLLDALRLERYRPPATVTSA